MFKNDWAQYQAGHPAVHNQIANRLNLARWADDYASVQAGVDALASAGGALYLGDKSYTLSAPLVLPRANPVHLIGTGRTQMRGSVSFPEGRALVEWEPVKARAYQQRITGIHFHLPDVDAVRAIRYQPTAKATLPDVIAEWMQIDLTDCWFYGSNTHHERFIHIEGGARASRFDRLFGEPKLDTNGYNTLLLEFDTEAPTGYMPSADAHGLFSSTVDQCYSMFSRGGKSAAIRGRLMRCEVNNTFCDGGSGTPCFDFYDSSMVVLRGLATEGRNEQPQYRFTRCELIDGHQIGIGTPDDYYGTGLGSGMELIDCHDCTFDARWNTVGTPSFSGKGCNVVTIDAASSYNTFTRWKIKSGGNAADEFTLAGVGNRIEYIDYGVNPVVRGVLTSD